LFAQVEHVSAKVLDRQAPSSRTTELLALLANLRFELKSIDGESWNVGENLPENDNHWACRPSTPSSPAP
jgi:hypothetical protein